MKKAGLFLASVVGLIVVSFFLVKWTLVFLHGGPNTCYGCDFFNSVQSIWLKLLLASFSIWLMGCLVLRINYVRKNKSSMYKVITVYNIIILILVIFSGVLVFIDQNGNVGGACLAVCLDINGRPAID